MVTLSNLIFEAENDYLRYLGRKTDYVLADSRDLEQIQWLWVQISNRFSYSSQASDLKPEHREILQKMLVNFCQLPASEVDSTALDLEEKLPWVFRHPDGSLFIPLEMVKSLMQEPELQKEHYLFTLLYEMRLKELISFASLVGRELEGQLALSFEQNALDMALVMYIWFAGVWRPRSRSSVKPAGRGRILSGQFQKTRKAPEKILFPERPAPAWGCLLELFPEQKEIIMSWKTLINQANKGFFRALSLLAADNRLQHAFRHAMLLPVLPAKPGFSTDKVRLVMPKEVFHLTAGRWSLPGSDLTVL